MAHGDKQRALLAQLEGGRKNALELAEALGWPYNVVTATLKNLARRQRIVEIEPDKHHRKARPGRSYELRRTA